MKYIYIRINNNIQSNIDLFHILLKNHIYFNTIYIIHNSDTNILFHNQLFFNLNNIIFIKNSNIKSIEFNNIKSIEFNNINDFIKSLNEFNIHSNIHSNISDLNILNYKFIYRNIKEETYIYNKLLNKINKYIFYYNKNQNNKIINYFEEEYIYNPFFNFYNKDDNYYNIWIDLKIKNIFLYLTIIKNSYEIHIFESDLLYLILLYHHEFDHIKKKYLYTKNIYIKEENINLKNWETVIIT